MSGDYTAGRIPGALPPPPGVTPNFVDPPNENANQIALHTVCLTLATLMVGMRVYLRAAVLRSFGWDDAFVVAGWAFAAAYSAITLKAMTLGLGLHLWDIPATKALDFGEWLFITEIETTPAWWMIKLSFFWSYLRVFGPQKAMRWCCWIGAFVVSALYVAEIFHDIFICVPVQKNWNPKLPGHCLPSGVGGSVTAIFNVISDIYILILPLPFVWGLQMQLYRKIRLMLLFAIGSFVNACSITRLVITYQVANDPDVSYKVWRESLWVTLEIYIGLICVCALVLPSFWNKIVLTSWSSLRSKTSLALFSRKHSAGSMDPERGLKSGHTNAMYSPTIKGMHSTAHTKGTYSSTASDVSEPVPPMPGSAV